MILEQLYNYGGFLSCYNNINGRMSNSQGGQHRTGGLNMEENEYPNFQIYTGANAANRVEADIYDFRTGSTRGLEEADIKIIRTQDGQHNWIRITREFSDLTLCGLYEIRVYINSRLNPPVYTEMFECANRNKRHWYELRFQSSYDIDNLLMQGNYFDSAWFNGNIVFPESETASEFITTGNSERELVSQNVKIKGVLELYDIPDYTIGAFSKLREHETVTIKSGYTNEVFELNEIEFSPKPQDTNYQTGTLKFTKVNTMFTGCKQAKAIDVLVNDV